MRILEGVGFKILWSHVHVIQNLTVDQYMKDEKKEKKMNFLNLLFMRVLIA